MSEAVASEICSVAERRKLAAATAVADVQALVFEALRETGILLQPVMPGKAGELLDALGVPEGQRVLKDAEFGKPGVGEVRAGVRLFEVGPEVLRSA